MCTTGVKEGSVVSDKVFIQFAHHPDVIQSEENFEFVVSFKAIKEVWGGDWLSTMKRKYLLYTYRLLLYLIVL